MVFGGIFRGRLCRCSLLYSISYGSQSAAQGIAAFIGQISESFIHIFAVDVINAVERIEFLPTQPVAALNFGSQIGNGLSNLFTVCVGDFFFPCFGAQNIEYCFGIVFSHRFSPRAIWPEFKLLYHKKTAGASVNFYDILTFVLLRYSKNFDSNRRILKENDGN